MKSMILALSLFISLSSNFAFASEKRCLKAGVTAEDIEQLANIYLVRNSEIEALRDLDMKNAIGANAEEMNIYVSRVMSRYQTQRAHIRAQYEEAYTAKTLPCRK